MHPLRTRLRSLLLTAASVACLASLGAATADAAPVPPGMPPAGKVMLGVGGSALDPTGFQRLTGAAHDLHVITVPWDEHRDHGWYYALKTSFDRAHAGGYRLVIHPGAAGKDGREVRSPGAVARGLGDAYLLDMGREINSHDEYVYVRPQAEMNGHWIVWSAFNRDGSRRNADHSTTMYKRAFIRIAEISRGGPVAAINARLRANGMPPLRTSASTLPSSGKVAMVWNPQAEGSPNVAGNHPIDYYPGAKWVDYVANDLYEQGGRAAWDKHEALYARFQKAHPFMVLEYAPWDYDGAGFVSKMFAWVATHPRTVALSYFNGTSTTFFRLASKPRTLATYRSRAKAPRYSCPGLTSTSTTC